jgi:hypothetical protein
LFQRLPVIGAAAHSGVQVAACSSLSARASSESPSLSAM